MIKETVVVSKIIANQTWVQAELRSTCGHCSERLTCSNQLMAKLIAQRELSIESGLSLKQGDKIIIAINESQLIKGSFICYILPLLALFLGVLIGVKLASFWLIFNSDLVTSLAAFSCFGLSLLSINKWQTVMMARLFEKPVVLRKLN